MEASTCVVLIALGHLSQEVSYGRADSFGAVPQVLGTFLHLQGDGLGHAGELYLLATALPQSPPKATLPCTLTVSPGRGLSLPSRAAALASCKSLSRLCTRPSAESISRGPHAS